MSIKKELRDKINEMSNAWIDKGYLRIVGLKKLRQSKMEKDLVVSEEQLDFEHGSIV